MDLDEETLQCGERNISLVRKTLNSFYRVLIDNYFIFQNTSEFNSSHYRYLGPLHNIILPRQIFTFSRYYFDGVLVSSCGTMGVVGNILTLCVLSRPKFRVRFLQVETQSS